MKYKLWDKKESINDVSAQVIGKKITEQEYEFITGEEYEAVVA